MEKMDAKFQKELREALPPVPDLFKSAMEETLSEIVAQETGERKEARIRRVRPDTSRAAEKAARTPQAPKRHAKKRPYRKSRTGLLILVAALLLATVAFAVASRMNALEAWWIDLPKEKEEEMLQRDLASYREGDIEVRMEEAAYDGMTLYLVYSVRDHSDPNMLGEDIMGDGNRYIDDGAPQGAQEAGFGWWNDNVYINGWAVMPIHGEQVFGGPNPGEALHYWQADYYLLDVEFTGDEVEIGIPILPHTEADKPRVLEDGTMPAPEHGLFTFKLDLDMARQKRVEYPDFGAAQFENSAARVGRVVYTPLGLYVNVNFTATQEAIDEMTAKNTEEFGFDWPGSAFDVACEEGWESLCFADGDGNYLGEAYMSAGADESWYTLSAMETWPDEIYLAYAVRDDAWNVTDVVLENALRIR